MSSAHTLYLNGRFLTQQMTGVQRFAHEVVRALDELIDQGVLDTNGATLTLLVPPGERQALPLRHIGLHQVGWLQGHAWEQLELPRYAAGGVLLNLCNVAPIAKRNQVVVMHDAAVFAAPAGYTLGFRMWYRFLLRSLARTGSRIATVSEFSRRELARYLGMPSAELMVVEEGVDQVRRAVPDNAIFIRAGIGKRPYVLAVSSTNPNKNFDVIAQALPELGEPDFDVVVAGNTNPRIFKQDVALPSFVKRLGYVSDAELIALYRKAACFVFPSKYEGFGLPPLEAMACGTAVIVADAASLPEVCGTGAMYFDPENPSELAACLRKVMGDSDLRRNLERYGEERASKFSWKRCAERLVSEAMCIGSTSTVKQQTATTLHL